jgi:hypothetical protein
MKDPNAMWEDQRDYEARVRSSKRLANIGLGLGFVLHTVAGVLIWRSISGGLTWKIGWGLVALGCLAFAFGGWHLAEEKGYPPFFGLIGLFGLPGFLLMLFIPDNE